MAWRIGRREVAVAPREEPALAPVMAQLAAIEAAEAAWEQQRAALQADLEATLRAAWAAVQDDEARRDSLVAYAYWQLPAVPLRGLAALLGVPVNTLGAYAGPWTEAYACPGCGTAQQRAVRSRSELQGLRSGLKSTAYGPAPWLLCEACTAVAEARHAAAAMAYSPTPVRPAPADEEPQLYG